MGSTVMESSKDSSKKMPKKKKSLRINMPDFGAFTSPQVETSDSTKSGAKTAERQIHSASPTKGESVRSPATLFLHSQSAPVSVRTSSGSPKTIFPVSLLPGLATQIPPPLELQWYLPLLIQLNTSNHQNLLQDEER
ncbi:hypothetical protein CesoFtcFv8_015105 [Champsocephalus esox]|uniref:Uncharacterized protein n=1 Tax=Champsocephalus esox TaxID=159716 RepID=A0AAN8BP45_9TELE|nr:hypothetical protein CesoFtcFv8_015105 [Champsocephalus esox]